MTDILRDIWGSHNSDYKQVIFHETQIINGLKCPSYFKVAQRQTTLSRQQS